MRGDLTWKQLRCVCMCVCIQAIEKHQKMIKECRGVPGVKMDRWNAAFTVRHMLGEGVQAPANAGV